MGLFSWKKKVLGFFLMAKEELSTGDATWVCQIVASQFLKDYKWDGKVRTCYNLPFERFDTPEHAICHVIQEGGLAGEITDKNSVYYSEPDSWPDPDVCYCVLIKGRVDGLRSAQEALGRYVGVPMRAPKPVQPAWQAAAQSAGSGSGSGAGSQGAASGAGSASVPALSVSGSYNDPFEDVGNLPYEVSIYVRGAEQAEDRGDLMNAALSYLMALQADDRNVPIMRRFARVGLQIDELKPRVFWIVNEVFSQVGVSALTGRDFSLLAQSLYAHVAAGTTAEIDAELAAAGGTAQGYMIQAISDARYLGYDGPELAQMEAAVKGATKKGAKSSYFFNRTR